MGDLVIQNNQVGVIVDGEFFPMIAGGALIDFRTLAAIATSGTATYAHGLSASPDMVWVSLNQTSSSTTAPPCIAVTWDATNVTVNNQGGLVSPTLKACAVVFHSLIK